MVSLFCRHNRLTANCPICSRYFGRSVSPNGMIEYRNGEAFGGALRGKILVTRYSGGDDILVLAPAPGGGIAETVSGIDGFRQFIDPLDLTEHVPTGRLYVAEYGGQRLTLLRPKPAPSHRVMRWVASAAQ